ncbi:MAG: hypothetical protein IJP92_09805, partial [Lachnospiraceae bacterium]|nr:hypothetical protein [Lachnospiraceae bacterium]
MKIIENKNRCPACMQHYNDNERICPHCGWDFAQRQDNLHALPPFTLLENRYLIGNIIGEGGFGITYIAYDQKFDVRVAIKEFYPSGMVTREAKITSAVTSYTGKPVEDFQK